MWTPEVQLGGGFGEVEVECGFQNFGMEMVLCNNSNIIIIISCCDFHMVPFTCLYFWLDEMSILSLV